ncbi:MAG: hypothetical protein ABH896_03145, partial [Candidatus Jacksonbacteria bacterium]
MPKDPSINNQQNQNPADVQQNNNQQDVDKERDLKKLTPDEFAELLAKLKHLSRRQKAGKTYGYIKTKVKPTNLPLARESDKKTGAGDTKTGGVDQEAQEDQQKTETAPSDELGEDGKEPSLAERIGLGQKSIDQMSKQEKQEVKGKLAEPGNLEEMFRGNQGDPNLGRQNEDGTMNYINPETGFYQKEKPQMSPIRNLDRIAGRDTYTTPEGQEVNRKDYDPYQQRQIEKKRQLEKGQEFGPRNIDGSQNYFNPKTAEYQKEDPNMLKSGGESEKESWKDKSKAFGTKLAGKAAGKAISAVAEHGGPVSAVLIYGLALANDFPDLLNPIIEWLSLFSWSFVDFLFDVCVFLGFRYFLRDHINVPGVKVALYVCAIAEILPIPILDHIDIFPFWTLCAWLALRQI